jgi:quinol monooxygenase YgiN
MPRAWLGRGRARFYKLHCGARRVRFASGRVPLAAHFPGENTTLIHVLAMITAKPGQREKILEVFRANVPACRAEGGCIEYGATIDAVNAPPFSTPFGPDTFVVVETWASVEALKAHAAAPHMAAYAARVKDYIANRVVHVLSPT